MKNTRKILALVLVLMMVLPMFTMFTVSAATPAKLYLTPNANWKADNARFAAYFFGNGETWVSMTDADKDGIYECTVPTGYPSVIFCRMNPGTTVNNWDNKWNQTADLSVPTNGNDYYTVKENTWDKGGGTWSKYIPPQAGHKCNPVEDTSKYVAPTCTTDGLRVFNCVNEGCENPQTTKTVSALGHAYQADNTCSRCGVLATYIIAGSSALCNGQDWNTAAEINKMSYNAETGIYTLSIDVSKVAAGTYEYKVARDGAWGDGQYPEGMDNKSIAIKAGDATVLFTWNPAAKSLTAEAHAHSFVEGKCSCGAEDPNYAPVHVNALVVGDTNKILIDAEHGAYDNGAGYPTVTLPFVVTEAAHYKFAAEGVTIVVATATDILSYAGEADLEAGTYYISLAFNDKSTGKCNVVVTKTEIPAHVNTLVVGDTNKIIIDADHGAYVNDLGYPTVTLPFVVAEAAHYKFAAEGVTIVVATATDILSYAGEADLEAGTYYISLAFNDKSTGKCNVVVTKTVIGGGDPVDPTPTHGEQEFVLGENTVIIDGCTLNMINSPVEMVKFVVTVKAKYTFVSDINTYISTSSDPDDLNGYLGGAFVEEGILEPGTYYLCCGNNGALGEFAVTVEKTDLDENCEHEWKTATCAAPKTCTKCGETEGEVDPLAHAPFADTCLSCGKDLPSFKVGDNHVSYVAGAPNLMPNGDLYVKIEITEPGKYIVSGGAPVKVYMWSVPTSQLVDGQLTLDTPYRWNIDTDKESGFADSFEIDLPEAGVYWIGFAFEFVGEETYEFDINIAPYEEPAPQSFFDMILAWIMSFIEMILGWFKF